MIFIWLDDERKMPVGTRFHGYKMFHAHNYEECINIINYAHKQEEDIYSF